jgi:hypothetical protein
MSSRGSWNLEFGWILMEESDDETKDEGYWD